MCIFIKHITCVGLRTNQAEKMRLSIWHMWRFEAKVAIVKRANESGGLQKAAAAGPEFPALGNWRHFVKNLSRPVKLSAAHPPSYEAKTCQTVRTAYNQERPPQNGGEEGKICKYGCGAGLAPEHFEVWWTGVVRLRQFEGWLWLIVDPHLSWIWIKTRMFQTGSVDRARSGGCQSGSRLCLRRQSDDEAAAWPTMEKSCSSQSVLSRNSYLIRNIYTVALQIFYLTIFTCDNNCIFYKV